MIMMENILELVKKTRSFRRFDESKRVDISQLRYMVEVARITASARNYQPLKYITITNPELCDAMFPATGWARSLPDGTPVEGERPTGYIVILNDKNIAPNSLWDQGIVSYAMMMAATEMGLGGCIIATIYHDKLPELNIPENLHPVLVLAVGTPIEDVRIVDMVDNKTNYYRDEQRVHYVPKRVMSDILVSEFE